LCLSVTSRSSVEMDEWIKLVFGTEAIVALFYNELKWNWVAYFHE